MSNKECENFNEYLKKFIENKGYLEKYGGSAISAVLILVVAFVILSYLYIKNHLKSIKLDWANKRCRPEVIPFAGIINAPKGKSVMEFTGENFVMCTSNILSKIAEIFLKPFYSLINIFIKTFSLIIESISYIAIFFSILRKKLMKYFSDFLYEILNIILPLQKIFIKIKDILGKTGGILSLTIYNLLTFYQTLKSFFGAFLEVVIIFLVALAAIVVTLWFLPLTWIPAAVGTSFYALILILFIPIVITLGEIAHVAPKHDMPDNPDGCFDKNTKIKLKNGYKKFRELKVNDVLRDGAKVTAFFKISSKGIDMYKINKLIVSGTHKIYYEEKGWIAAAKHPDAKLIIDYTEPYIYCINTTSKKIYIDEYILLDWDDIDELDFIDLKSLTSIPINAKTNIIHSDLEGGFHKDTTIELEDGHCVNISDIKVNDILRFGEKVIGIVEIDSNNISNIYKYNIDGKTFIGGPNLWINDNDLGKFSTLALDSKSAIQKNDKLYQIITNTGNFKINGIQFMDYNSAIEQIMGDIWSEKVPCFSV